MNLKRIFGAILTILGIVGLIYAAVLFVNNGESNQNIKMLATYGILGLVFFVSGINLVRTTKDEA
ncbi:hypothetical protein [Flavobacterium tibetense]|uniref:Uncharacterized protein n=1 Tax=Flavobacterium tibetense TaxID=2233533 RepID=A0A365P4Z4_9FLAO|nr:hypothetical protein [Flavobacterium tibetense]RBA29670.1 hypothetical protein DPN68_00115 [Flavobacterium tibetense]